MSVDKFNDTLSSFLEEGRVMHVINVLKSKCRTSVTAHPDLGGIISELGGIEETYRRMREYMLAGNPDPERDNVLDNIRLSLKRLGRQYLFIVNEDRPDPMFAEYRMQKLKHKDVAEIAAELEKNAYHLEKAEETEADTLSIRKKKEELVDALFRKVWSLPPGAEDDIEAVGRLLEEGDFELRAQLISALLLSLLKFYDPDKFLLLLKVYSQGEDERIESRALLAIVLVLSRWGASAVASREIEGYLSSLEDSILTYTRMRDILMTLIRTRDTDRVSREVNEAFSSTMKEITPEMLEKLQRDGMAVDDTETGLNPEWEKLMKNKEIEEKMQSINEMQLQGMDVMMQTFARLKSFPFFRNVSNWFLPFSKDHSLVAPLFDVFGEEGFSAMAEATEMCSGDRFSFVLGILQMPEERRNMLAANVNASLEMVRDQLKDRDNIRRRNIFGAEALSFARDLYRFAKVFPRHQDFYDPFEKPVDFLALPVIGNLVNEKEIILTAADFYFDHGYHSLALPLYEEVIEYGGEDATLQRHIYEKTGYCYQMISDYGKALDCYEKADLFSSDADESSTWLLKRLAFCNKASGRYEKAAEYYRKLLERDPDDLNLEFHLATVLLRSGNAVQARELISKVHYLQPDHKICNRIYTRLKGHEAFKNGNLKEALDLYESARGEQNPMDYRRDLEEELRTLYPEADVKTLQILLDSGD